MPPIPLPTKTKQWTLAQYPSGLATFEGPDATFKLSTADLPPLSDGQVLLQQLHLSNDPAQRAWISTAIPPERSYVAPVQPGEVMRVASTLSRVLDSKAPELQPGEVVLARGPGWQEYAVVDGQGCRKVQELPGVSLTHYLGALGGTGLTAYVGLLEIGRTTAQDVVVVSGAAGATGSLAVQIAKHIIGSKKVVGIAGGDAKCRWVESLGADACVDYKSESFEEDLKKATDGYADVYFDNVGGTILDLMFGRMKMHGRIIACGSISGYNDPNPPVFKNFFQVITQRLEIKGFIVVDWVHKAQEYLGILANEAKQGKIRFSDDMETVVGTKFEDIPKTWLKLFAGGNQGKLVTKLV